MCAEELGDAVHLSEPGIEAGLLAELQNQQIGRTLSEPEALGLLECNGQTDVAECLLDMERGSGMCAAHLGHDSLAREGLLCTCPSELRLRRFQPPFAARRCRGTRNSIPQKRGLVFENACVEPRGESQRPPIGTNQRSKQTRVRSC